MLRIVIDRPMTRTKLPAMRLRRLLLTIAIVPTAAGCRDRQPSVRDDSGQSTIYSTASRGRPTPFLAGVEPLLFVPGESPDRGIALFADTTLELTDAPRPASATFLRPDGSQFSAQASFTTASPCIEVTLDPAPAEPWGAGFAGGSLTAVATDSVRGLGPADSTALTRMLFRLASSVPNDSSGRFTGLPFTLVDLWRFVLPDGATVVLGVTRRQINQEDSPLEERTMVLAESASGAAEGFAMAMSRRSVGPEETVESLMLLGVVAAQGAAAPYIVTEHDFGDAASYSLLERSAPGRWAVRWMSRRSTC